MKNLLILLLISSIELFPQSFLSNQAAELIKSDEDGFAFFIIGDWGRNGSFNQKQLAEVMNEAAAIIEPEFIISTGDNFYENGVASIDDPLWLSSFENIYNGGNLLMEWRPVLGNHDYRGNVQAQIDYSKKSRRWNMPAKYYSTEYKVCDNQKILFAFIDTNPFDLSYYKKENYRNVWNEDTTSQKKWLDSLLSASNADWKIVIGHHPLYTGGLRKDEKTNVKTAFESMFNRHNVNAYFCGHEHDLQHIKTESKFHHFISGAGSQVRPTGKIPASLFAESTQGFMIANVVCNKLFIAVVDFKGNVIYQTTVEKQK